MVPGMEYVHQYRTQIVRSDGTRYVARVYTDREPAGNVWEAWLVFFPVAGGAPVASDRETTQSKREDVDYWASGIEPIYLEGALARALAPLDGGLSRHAARDERYRRAEAALYRTEASGAVAQAMADARGRVA
jgi:hypothetical protein